MHKIRSSSFSSADAIILYREEGAYILKTVHSDEQRCMKRGKST
ncbi:hypothetical protein HMPREF1545_03449 [Oscillibacter sp. KLE 1728]|nr:hypothetical protein HMPREF1545_03449 [Oscillibacter sp. KLE 1728]